MCCSAKMESRRGGDPEDDGVGLRDADVTHSGEIVGRGGSGVVRKGTLRLPDGTVVAVAIKMLHAGATESEERSFRRLTLHAFNSPVCTRVGEVPRSPDTARASLFRNHQHREIQY